MGGGKCSTICGYALSASAALLEYDTAKIVHIHNKKVGIMNRLVQLAIVGYIVGYGIGWEHGYQKTGPVQSTVTTKLKGASHYDGSYGDYTQNCASDVEETTFDVADFVIPPQEPNGFFVMTNLWKTCNQTQGLCAEAPDVANIECNATNVTNCREGEIPYAGNGAMTGNCTEAGRCEIKGWCPTEIENSTITHYGPKVNASSFTVLVKNSIEFPNIASGRKRNIDDDASADYLKTCVYNSSDYTDRYCPIFSLGQIVKMAGENFTALSTQGGVIGLRIEWNCNLDWPYGWNRCNPVYSAKRLDNPDVKISKGFNFRFAKYHTREGYDSRDLIKAYGILFKVEVTGTGRAFDFVTLVLKLGSMIALLGIASVISDIVVLYVLKGRHFYRKKKYQDVIDPMKSYEPLDNSSEEDSLINNPTVSLASKKSDTF